MEMDDSDQEDMERTDTDSTDELSDGDRSPGFRPLRRLPASRHFPYSAQLDAEAAASLQRIKQNLSAALLLQDRVGLQLYLIRLSSYLNVYNVFMSKEDYILLIRLVERCAVSSFSDYRNVDQCGRLLVLLMKRVKRHITRDDLEIEWRPLFDLYVSFSKHPFRGTRFTYQLDATVRTVKSMVRCCRSFFAAGATGELLAVVLPELCLFDSATSWVLDCLELFLPTDLPPALYDSGWRLWLPRLRDIFQLMENSGPWDQMLSSLFSRLAWYNPGQLDWSQLLPDVFSRLLRCFALPIGFRRVSSHHPNAAGIPPLTTWIVAMLGGGSETQTYLERLLEAVGSYFYASNTGPWHDLLSRFLSALCSLFTRRYNRERYMKNTWEHYTADTHCLTDEDVRRFVKAVLPCALLGIYWWSNGSQMCKCLRQLSQLCPDMVIPPVIESFHQSLETITEPHRLTCTMNALTSVLRSMAETGPRPELVPLLQLLLPAIDPNDKHKTMCAFVLIDRLSDIITFVDCSRSADDPALTEMEQQVCLQTAGMEDVVLQMMDRFLGLLEPNNVENTRQDHGRSEKVNQEETVLLSVMRSACFSILIKSSPEIQRLAVHKLKGFVTGTILDSRFSGRLAAVLCCGAIMANYELGLKALLPSVASTIISITEDEQSEEKPDQELIFNLLLLKEMTASCGLWLLPYRDTLELVLLRCRHLVHKEGSSLAADLLHSLLTGLTGTYVTDYGGWRAKLADTDRHHLLIKEWGRCVSMRSLEVQWHQASDEEVAWATQLVERFLLPELEELELFMNDVSRLNKDQLLCRLHLIHLGLKGAAGSLPPLSGPLADVGECSVDLTTLRMETAVRYLPLSADLRVRVIDVMHRLLVCLNEHRPDDTKSLSTLAVIMETAVVNHGVKRVENETEMKVLYDNRLSQGKDIGYKRFSSRVLAAWVQLQHNQRVVFANTIRPTKTLCDRVLVDLLTLSTSFYSQVRMTGQTVLSRCIFSSHQSYLTLWPRVVELLKSPDITHEQLKGVLYVIASNGRRSLLLRRNWEVAAALWPALVTCVVSEKESIVRLLEHIRKETLSYVMVPVQCQFPDTVDQLAVELYSPSPSSESRHQAALRMSAYNADNKQRHADLSNQLITLMENNSLHWRRYELALDLLSLLVRPEIPPSESFVRLTLNNLLHSSILVRKSFGLLLGVILKQQKPMHATVAVNPSEVCTLQHPARDWRPQSTEPSDGDGAAGWRNWPQLGERRDNAWLQYDSGTAPRDDAAWLQPRYVHKMKWGYSGWPQQTVVYRQLAEFPTDVNVVEARQVVDFFTDPASVEKLVNYFSMEENKGMDLFNTHCCAVFKGLARNYGEQVLDSLKPSLNRLAAETTESAQKCLCEMVAGLVRGSKHWPFASVERLWQYLIPLLRQSISKIHQETAHNWITCINTCVADRDINRQHWLVEMMLEPMFDRDEALFVTCVRIELMVRMTGEFEWRGAEVMHRIRDMISSQLCHPYQSIRRKLGCLLCKVFAVDVYGGPSTVNPRAAQFLDSVLPKLDVLLTVDSAPPAVAVTSSLMETETAGSGQVRSPSPAQPATEAVSQERTDAHRLLQTLCHYVLSSASTRLLRFVGPEHVRLLPALCVMESYDIDRELQTDCVRTLQVMAVLRHDVRCMSALLAALDRVLAHPYWRVRLAALKFLQATAFHNMFQLLNNADMANKVTECVVKGLHDRRVEVRQMAVQVFSGLLHCGFIEQTQQLRLRTEFARMAAVRLGPRDDRDIYTARLRERHTGVLGLCGFVAASPYDVPAHLPAVLMTLGEHVNDPQPIQGTIRTTMTNFKRTHHENWRLHRQKFSDDQLTVLTDLLVSPSYYA